MKNYKEIFKTSLLWKFLAFSTLVSFSVLLFFGGKIYQQAPPMPTRRPHRPIVATRHPTR